MSKNSKNFVTKHIYVSFFRKTAAIIIVASFLLTSPTYTAAAHLLASKRPSSDSSSDPKNQARDVEIIVDGAIGKPAQFGIEQLIKILETKGYPFSTQESLTVSRAFNILLIGTLKGSNLIKKLKNEGKLSLLENKESLAVKRQKEGDKNILIISGADDRGLMYALLEIAQQIETLDARKNWYSSIKEVSESPLVPVRSMAILLHNEDCEKDWYYSKEHWQAYFGMLAANRWNAFNLIFSHQTPYLSPLYAFHVNVDQHPEVKARGLAEEQRIKNLEMLRYISSLARERGINFTIGIWQQIAWAGKHQGSRQESMVTGLSRKNMYSYTYNALKNLLEECPDISTVQLRINHESGIDYDEQTDFYKNAVFKAIKDCGRRVLLETRNVGLLRETVQAALDVGLPTRVSHKYWGEHMVSPYHPTRIMWTYSYGDWLKYPQKYQNMYQVWTLGSHRLFLWGDPDFVRRFAPTTRFQNAVGFEICAPLSQKGYGNEPGAWRIFRDREREYYKWEFERYWSFYRLFGRLTYNPETSDEIWQREMRHRFGNEAVPEVARAYKTASRILPLIMGSATIDYNMGIWPEKDMGGLINFYLHFITFNKLRISNFIEFVDNTIEGKHSAKLTPEEIATRLEAIASECEKSIVLAENLIKKPNKEFWATKKDFQILSGMARYFAQKIRAAYNLGFYYTLGDLSLLKKAISNASKGLEIWKKLSAVAEEIYYPNLVMGPGSYGHWKDNIVFVKNDLEQLLHQEELFKLLQNFDFGFDFGPKAYTSVTTIYTPYYTNYYTIEHRFQGVFPHSFFNPQQGFGWNKEVVLKAEQPPKIPRRLWRASNLKNLDIPSQALLGDFIQGSEPAVFRIDLPEGHYQATLIITDKSPNPSDHGPMSVSVIERFGERPIITDKIVCKGETLIERFNFNMVGSRYSNFRLKLSAAKGADFIFNGLTFTRIEPHIAHLPLRRAIPGKDLVFKATVTLPVQVLQPHKTSLSIARGTTSTIEPPEKIEGVSFYYSTDNGRSYRCLEMKEEEDMIYSVTLSGQDIQEGEIRYYMEASDSIGQTVHLPKGSQTDNYYPIKITNDLTPPVTTHAHEKEWNPGEPLQIKATVIDDSSIAKVLLYYRPTRQAMEYSITTMYPEGNNVYSATIPGKAITKEFDLMYYIEALDEFGNGIFYPDPDVTDPHIIIKVRR